MCAKQINSAAVSSGCCQRRAISAIGRIQRGFTLIELMVVVSIIGILAAIAYPSYQEYIRKGKRAEGRTALMELMQQQERYMTDRNTYLAFAKGATNTPFKTWSGDKGLSGASYQISAAQCGSAGALEPLTQCVLLTAVPAFTDSRAGSLSVDSRGNKSCTGSQKETCW